MERRNTYEVGQVLQTAENDGINSGDMLIAVNHKQLHQFEHDQVMRELQKRPLLLRFQSADGQQFDQRFELPGQLGLQLDYGDQDTTSPARRTSRTSETVTVFSEDNWQPDEEATDCPLCERKFNAIRRRHHCRTCMRVICGKCSRGRAALSPDKKERVCDDCAEEGKALWSNVTDVAGNTTVEEMQSALEVSNLWHSTGTLQLNRLVNTVLAAG